MNIYDGKFHFQILDGKILSYSIASAIDNLYLELFDKYCERFYSDPTSEINAIQLTIFGTLYIEAVLNFKIKDHLMTNLKPEQVEPTWSLMKMSSVANKLTYLDSINESKPDNSEGIMKCLTSVFDMRNRLVHFKEKDYSVVLSEPMVMDGDLDSINQIILSADPPQIVSDLRSDNVYRLIKNFNRIFEWLATIDTGPENQIIIKFE